MDSGSARAWGLESAGALLGPYVPTLVADWLRDRPTQRHQMIDCTLVFADISGFTRMTELLGARGRIGAEEMAELINLTFDALLVAAYDYGAGLIKWGGDATLLFFDGDDHAGRGCRAACEMQRVIGQKGGLRTSRGPIRLRMSIGINSGDVDFFLIGSDDHRELAVIGEAVTVLSRMEKIAGPGQIVISDGTHARLKQAHPTGRTVPRDDGWWLRHTPPAERQRVTRDLGDYATVDLGLALCRALREQILEGGLEYEHREAAVSFIKFTGVDQLLADAGPAAVLVALEEMIGAVQSAAERHQVAFLATDIGTDGGKLMLSAGAPQRVGHDEDRMIATVRSALRSGGVLPLRAGVTSGRAFAGGFGPAYRRTYSLMGDCVNLAARLAEHAEPGELLGNDALVRAADGSLTATPRAPFAAKGKRAPVQAFTIGAPGSADPTGRDSPDSAPLIGRETELSVLLSAAQAAAAGPGRVVEVVGEPGMGKSRLLGELRARTDHHVLWADGDIYAGTRPYAPFERLLGVRREAGETTVSDGIADHLEAITRQRAPQLLPWLPLMGIVAGRELPSTPEVEQTDPGQRKERLEEVTSELMGLILDGPTILIFNDVQLMDDASRDLIARLAADAPLRRWLVVISRRPDSASLLHDAHEQIVLGPLSPAATARLLARATASAPLPPRRLAVLTERAAGNPLFLRELVAQITAGEVPDSLPSSVEGAIAARIDRLAPADRRTLRCAAVLGVDVELSLLAEVLGDADADAATPARMAPLDEFLEPTAPGRRRFSHQLVREVAYEGLPYRRRTDLHARTAAAIERSAGEEPEQHAELLSLHCLHGARYEAAWGYSRQAAQRARSRYANREAADSYRRALAAAGHVPDLAVTALAEVDEALGEICVEMGELAAADTALRRALGRVRSQPLAAARLQLKLSRLRDIVGRHALALRWAARAESTLSGLDGPDVERIRGQLAVRRTRISYRRGRHTAALAFAKEATRLAEQTGDLPTLAEALEYGDLSAVELGLPAGAGAARALAIYHALGDPGAEARVHNTLGLLAYHRGAWSDALAAYEAAERAYERAGTRWDLATAVGNAAEILADQGHFEAAQAGLERAMLIWRGVEAGSEVAFGEYQLGRLAARLGRPAEAADRFLAARQHFLAAGELTEVVVVDALTAEALGLAGDARAALQLADETLARAQALGGMASATPLLQRVRGAALLQLGRRPEAERVLREGLEAARIRGAGHEVAFTLGALIEADVAAGSGEARAWQSERATLAAELGIEPEAWRRGQATRT